MIKAKRIICILLCMLTALCVTGCAGNKKTLAKWQFDPISGAYIPSAVDKSYADSADEALLAKMEKKLSTAEAELYMSAETFDIAVKDLRSGKIFFSNKSIYTKDFPADGDYAQVNIEYYDGSDNIFSENSYTACVNLETPVQVDVEQTDTKLVVNYRFGTKTEDRLLPPAFTVETHDILLEKMEQLKKEKKLTVMQVGRYKMNYQHIAYDALSDSDRTIYLKKYPALEKVGALYVLKDGLTDIQKQEVEEVLKKVGVTKEFMEEELKKIGDVSNSQMKAPYFEIPVFYTLDGGDLLAGIDTAKVVMGEDYYLTKIELLPHFYDAEYNANGYVFLPDGSGTISELSHHERIMTSLDIPFYGSDFAIDHKELSDIDSYAPFPVFGCKQDDASVFCVVESGDAMGGVSLRISTGEETTTRVYPWFNYLVRDEIDLKGYEEKNSQNTYTETVEKNPYTVRYHFLYGGSSAYSGMAQYYRSYLEKTEALKMTAAEDYALNINYIGAFTKKKTILGIAYNGSESATTFEQAQSITEELKKAVSSKVEVSFEGAVNGGLDFALASKLKLEKKLGGEKGYKALCEALKNQGDSCVLKLDFMRVFASGNGLHEKTHLARFLDKNFAKLYEYSPATGLLEPENSAYLVSPAAYKEIVSSLAKEYGKLDTKQIYLSTAAAYLSGDYKEDAELSREQAKYAVSTLLQSLSKKNDIRSAGCNAYTLKYLSKISDLPVSDSGYRITSYSVPFVAMVLHGSIPYSGPVLNNQGNYQKALLNSIESGAELAFSLMNEEPIVFSDTHYNKFYSMTYETWKEKIPEEYLNAQKVLEPLKSLKITEHRHISEDVNAVTYEDGTVIYLNYGETAATVNGVTVEAASYKAVKGE